MIFLVMHPLIGFPQPCTLRTKISLRHCFYAGPRQVSAGSGPYLRVNFGILTKMTSFPKRPKIEFKLGSKNRSKPIGKPTFGGSSWRPMLASSWLQKCHFACFLFMGAFCQRRRRFSQNCIIFTGFFKFFAMSTNSFLEVGRGFTNWAWMFKTLTLEGRKTLKKPTFLV